VNADPADAINATVSGGEANEARGAGAFIGGGFNNVASGTYSVIGGGQNNSTSGGTNIAPGFAVVGGGDSNAASGLGATVPGGRDNSATGTTSFAAGNRAKASHNGTFVWADNTAVDFASTDVNQFLIRAGGGVGINTNNPLAALHVNGGIHSSASRDLTYGTSDVFALGEWDGTTFTERMRISASGFVGINDTSPDFHLDVNGDINASGSVRSNGTALFSDARFKTDIHTFPNALETIQNLRGVTYDWRRAEFKERKFPTGRQIGFIAQEVEKVLPELVSIGPDGYRAVAYVNLVPVLVEAVKAQQKQMESLKKDNDATKKENAELKTTLADVLQRLEQLERANESTRK
jgi:trimeric autotransporter adhesin